MGLRRVALRALFAWIVASGLLARQSAAEGLTGYLELNYNHSDADTADATGQSQKSTSRAFAQRYSLTLDKRIYPNFSVLAGGFFERQDSTFETGGVEGDSTTTSTRPFVRLSLNTPLYGADAAYTRNEEKLKSSGGSPAPTVRETYSSTLYWRPDGFPDVRLEYFRSNHFDKDHRTLDTTEDRFGITTNYRPVTPLELRYQVASDERTDRLNGNTFNDIHHNGRVNYADTWWRGRVSVASDYNIIRDETKTRAEGAGEVSFQLFPFAGLSGISDTPDTGALDVNLLLIDGDLAAGAGINLGLPPPGGEARPRNMGMDFGAATEVNTLLVVVDRDVAQIADAFSWRIYTSSDNLNWALRQTVFPAAYSSFFTRFEIRFTNVTARYVKAVVAPLSIATPSASSFPTILVTELQAELRRTATEVAGKRTSTTHLYNLNVRTRILETPSLTYEFGYLARKVDPSPFPAEYTVSNGLSFLHQFTKVFSGRARVAREDGQTREGRRWSYLYTASVTAVPLETLNHTLLYSGVDETIAENKTVSNSFFLYNNAKLYEGIDLALGGGLIFSETGKGEKADQTQINGSATLVPHSSVTINLAYTGSTTTASGGEVPGDRKTSSSSWEANVAITPLPTLILFGSYRTDSRSTGGSQDTNVTRNYVLNFSPFPYGTLHLNFSYNETVRSADDTRERSILPSLRWNITPRSYLDFSYQKLTTDSPVLSADIRAFSGTFRMNF